MNKVRCVVTSMGLDGTATRKTFHGVRPAERMFDSLRQMGHITACQMHIEIAKPETHVWKKGDSGISIFR